MIELRRAHDLPDPAEALKRLIHQHGVAAILRAAVVALVRSDPVPRRADLSRLDDRLRRDIGLPPLPCERRPWDLRP